MKTFLLLLEFLLAIGVLVALVSNYLIINKLWKRRAIREVAESISIGAALLGLATSFPFFVQFVLIDQNLAAAAKALIGIATGIVFVLVGSGIWVRQNRGLGFWRLFLRAFRLERAESTDLLKSLVQPRGAQEIVEILQRLAAIDKEIDEREIALLREFAEGWRVELPEMTAGRDETGGDLIALRKAVQDYVGLEPPSEQALQLIDVLELFARVDTQVSHEEDIALEETKAILQVYVSDGEEQPVTFEVLIVPQNDQQIQAVREILPGLEMEERRGGRVFSVGHFFSARYADVVCGRYIDLGLFTARVERDSSPAS
jgi:hypothetical protein